MNQEKGKIFVISGPSGVGKGTIVQRLIKKNPEVALSTSVTTRAPRSREVNGIHYFFIKKETFLDKLKKGCFLEWTEFAGNYYGTDKNIMELTLKEGFNLILEIDVKGALQVKEKRPEAILIFIEPPSIDELKSRLFKRKTESETQIQERLSIVKSELEKKDKFDYCILNDNLDKAFIKVEKIICKYLKIKL